jgi:hypothetical protein
VATIQRYYSRTQAAAILDCCTKTLRNLHNKGTGPTVVVIGNRPRYPAAELEAWLAERTLGGR